MLLTDGEWVFMVTWMYSENASISVYRNLLAWTNICPFFPVVLIGHMPCIPHTLFHPLMPPNHFSNSFVLYCVLGHVHIPFWSDFFTECNLVLPLSISVILSFPEGHPVAAYVFFLIFPSFLSFFLAYLPFIVFKHLPGCNFVIPEYGVSVFLWKPYVNQWTYNVSKPRRCSSVLLCN